MHFLEDWHNIETVCDIIFWELYKKKQHERSDTGKSYPDARSCM